MQLKTFKGITHLLLSFKNLNSSKCYLINRHISTVVSASPTADSSAGLSVSLFAQWNYEGKRVHKRKDAGKAGPGQHALVDTLWVPVSLVSLADILYCGPERVQQSTKGNKLILDLEGSAALQAKKCRKACANKQVHWHYTFFLRHSRSLASVTSCQTSCCGSLWLSLSLCAFRKYFCWTCRQKGIYKCPVCETRYCSLKCKGVQKIKCKRLASRNKGTN